MKDKVLVAGDQIPGYRVQQAFKHGTNNNFLMVTCGGLGDQVCAEPTLRFALEHFSDCNISLSTQTPELYTHLNFKEVMSFNEAREKISNYLVFETLVPPDDLKWHFYSACLTHAVDYASICAFRFQLPVKDREIRLPSYKSPEIGDLDNKVIIHPGKHWASRTFPKVWWNATIHAVKKAGFEPVIIGKELNEHQGVVDVDIEPGVLDLRNKLSLTEFIGLLKNCKYLISNDSSPIHIAAAGSAHILMIASSKHPDFITHWRSGIWGWRTHNLGLDGIWNHQPIHPATASQLDVDNLPEGLMDKILPHPKAVAERLVQLT